MLLLLHVLSVPPLFQHLRLFGEVAVALVLTGSSGTNAVRGGCRPPWKRRARCCCATRTRLCSRLPSKRSLRFVKRSCSTQTTPSSARFSRSGASFTQKLSSAKGAVRFLKALGFEEEGGSDATSSLVLPAAAASAERLAAGKAALKAVLKQHTEMWTRKADEERRKENEASVQKLADLRAVSKRNSAKRDAEDEQLRRQLVAGISADKAEDQKWRTEYDAMGLPGNKPVS